MKRIVACFCGLLLSVAVLEAQTIAQFTFETSLPAGTPGAGNWLTNISAEVGSGTASGFHAGAATYSSPAGNGSAHSFSANTWAPGDFYQVAVSTVGFNDIGVSYDQVSSATGPGQFSLQYSTDGILFTRFGSPYTVLVNTAPNTWNASTPVTTTSFSYDLSSINSLNDAPTVYFRLVDESTTSANGGSVAAGGTGRFDNFVVSQIQVPEPASSVLLAGGLLGIVLRNRFRRA